MFGTNERVGKSYFKDADGKLLVTSMFVTLQGEGPFAGLPAVFIRLAKCNLNCFMCDAFFDAGDWMTHDEIFFKIETLLNDYYGEVRPGFTHHYPEEFINKNMVLVITGGEPTLQDLNDFCEKALTIFENVQIESNGIVHTELPDDVVLVVSPKCFEKDGVAQYYLKPNEKTMLRANCLKFVVTADENSPYHTVPEWVMRWRDAFAKDVYISPMNVYNDLPKQMRVSRMSNEKNTMDKRSTVDEVVSFWNDMEVLDLKQNQANHEYAARYCIENGFRLNLQMHLFASLA